MFREGDEFCLVSAVQTADFVSLLLNNVEAASFKVMPRDTLLVSSDTETCGPCCLIPQVGVGATGSMAQGAQGAGRVKRMLTSLSRFNRNRYFVSNDTCREYDINRPGHGGNSCQQNCSTTPAYRSTFEVARVKTTVQASVIRIRLLPTFARRLVPDAAVMSSQREPCVLRRTTVNLFGKGTKSPHTTASELWHETSQPTNHRRRGYFCLRLPESKQNCISILT